ncbi:Magnesium and cobalt transport protein CorA [Deinococcus marmoris]|uniref:Magnesium and cobalt transport protein CorA n=1 Tax=Deinococcus marmoris TaxID=249408 RepID=A0A1U7NRK2_9DEIO|nr:Magnesium and cobalt transport protein CorA [Deinococcus marmoris]
MLAQPDFQGVEGRKAEPKFSPLEGRFERTMDATQLAREVVLGSFDLYMAGMSRKTNDAVQILTIVTVGLGVVSAVAGAMGTNFNLGFFKSGTPGFILMLLGMTVLVALTLLIARRRHLI